MEHLPFSEIVNSIAAGNWGRQYETMEEAKKDLANDTTRLTAYALVELLKRLEAVASAVGESRPAGKSRGLTIPENAKSFPGKNIGDRVFSGDLDCGFAEYVIIAKNEEDVCLIVRLNNFDLDYPPHVGIACGSTYATIEEAIQAAAEEDKDWHSRRLEYAVAAAKAAAQGGELAKFCEGFDSP